jgi:hypothetical protein
MSSLNAAICITTYLERQKCYGPDKKILFNKQLFDLKVKGQGPTKVITLCDTPATEKFGQEENFCLLKQLQHTYWFFPFKIGQ